MAEERGVHCFVYLKTWDAMPAVREIVKEKLRQVLVHDGCRDIRIKEPFKDYIFFPDEEGEDFDLDDDTGELVRGRIKLGWAINAVGLKDG